MIAAHPRPGAGSPSRSEAGFSVVLAVAAILALLILGLAMVSVVAEDSDLSVNHVRSNQAFYAAHAGVEYAVRKVAESPSWTGLPAPGKTIGAGSFWIAPPDRVDEKGAPLPPGQLRIVASGVVGDAKRSIEVHVASGAIGTQAGSGEPGYSGDGGAATAARLRSPAGLATAANGDLYLCDSENHVVRKISVTGTITTVAGSGSPGYAGDKGPAVSARLRSPKDVAVGPGGDLFIADTGNHVIRRVAAATGVITTVAGSGSPGSSGDGGPATAARLNSPRGVQAARNGDLYISDRSNCLIRKVTAATGTISTCAGTGAAGYSGDGGPPTFARFRFPEGLHLTPSGELYVADTGNHVIRRISADGIVTTFAGSGAAGYAGDGGPATAARLSAPAAVHPAPSGDVYIVDTGNDVVRAVKPGSGIITTVAGAGASGFGGDGGPAPAAMLDGPCGIAVARGGLFYVADGDNHRVRSVGGSLAVTAWIEARR